MAPENAIWTDDRVSEGTNQSVETAILLGLDFLAIILLFFVGSALAALYHADEQVGDAAMRAGFRAGTRKEDSEHAATHSMRQADAAYAHGDRASDRAKEAWHAHDGRSQAHHEREADRHYANGDAHKRDAADHRRDAADHRDDAHRHFTHAEGHYTNAINGRLNTADKHYGGHLDARRSCESH